MRTVSNLKTMAGLVDARRARTSYGALLEWAMLEMEKLRLTREVERAERRIADIRCRLAEIGDKQVRLDQFVRNPSSEINQVGALPLPTFSVPPGRLKKRRLAY